MRAPFNVKEVLKTPSRGPFVQPLLQHKVNILGERLFAHQLQRTPAYESLRDGYPILKAKSGSKRLLRMPQPQSSPCPSLGWEADICQPLRQGLPEANTTQERQDRQHCSGCITRTEIHPWAQQPSYLGAGTTPVCTCPGPVASSGAGLAGSRNTQAAAVLHPLPKPFLCFPGCPCLC